jgi:Carbohydrate esterase, sialic acid-specific acetylesterase
MMGSSKVDPFVLVEDLTRPGWNFPDGKTPSSPRLNSGEATKIFIGLGQSNIANSGQTGYTPTNSTKVDNFDIGSGGVWNAVDPLLGAGINVGVGFGNWLTRFGDKLITAGACARIILVPGAIGQSSVTDWIAGGIFNQRMVVAIRRLQAAGLTPDAIFWDQGESDHGMAEATYVSNLQSIIDQSRSLLGFTVPWFVNVATFFFGATDSTIAAAQMAIVNGTNVFQGANSDNYITSTYRYNVHHLTAAGAEAVATDQVTAVRAGLGI